MQKLKCFGNESKQGFWSIPSGVEEVLTAGGVLKELAASFSKVQTVRQRRQQKKGVRRRRNPVYPRQSQELEGLLYRTGPC